MKDTRIAPSFIASTTSSAGGCTHSTTSASLTRSARPATKATSANAASSRWIAAEAPVCMWSLAPSLISLGTTEGIRATRRSCARVSFRTATLTYMAGSSGAGRSDVAQQGEHVSAPIAELDQGRDTRLGDAPERDAGQHVVKLRGRFHVC